MVNYRLLTVYGKIIVMDWGFWLEVAELTELYFKKKYYRVLIFVYTYLWVVGWRS